MKKYICSIIASAVFAVSALAYTGPAATVIIDVPFAFQAGNSSLPAGTYTVTEPINGFILIRGAKGGVFVQKTAIVENDESGKSKFLFSRAGSTYVLQTAGSRK